MGGGRPVEAVRAALWEAWRGGPQVHCFLCAHHCRIGPGGLGKCGVRENQDGVLYTLVYALPDIHSRRSHREEAALPFPARHLHLFPCHRGLQFLLQLLPERRHQPDAGRSG